MSLYVRYQPIVLGGGGGGGGITSINSDSTPAQTLTVGTAGTDFHIVDAGAGSHVFDLPTASASNRGALSSADWTTFNNKQSALTFTDSLVNTAGTVTLVNDTASPAVSQYYGTNSGGTRGFFNLPAAGSGTVTTVSVVSANGLAGTVANPTTTPAITLSTTVIGILQGNGTAISAATTGNLTDAGTDGITVTNGTGAVLGSGTSIAQHVADTTHNGYLSSTDWNTFNGKQSALTFTDSLVNTAGTVTLVNDSASPGNSKYYGTNSGGTFGYFSLPASGSGFNYLASNTSVYGGTNTTLSFTGVDNTVVGVSAGSAMTSDTDNTLYGYQAGISLVGSLNNTIIGSQTAANLFSGHDNILIGYNVDKNGALTGVADSSFIGIGNQMILSHGGVNGTIAIGPAITINGDDGVAIGQSVVMNNSGGIAIGSAASVSSGGLNCISIGNSSVASNVDSIVIGAAASDNGARYISLVGAALQPASSTHQGCVILGSTTNTSTPVSVTSAANQITFGSSGTNAVPATDMFIGRGAVGDATAPNITIQPSPVAAGNSNVAGGSLTLLGGNSTGTGVGGSVVIKTSPAGSTGSTQNTPTTAVTVDSTQNVTVAGLAGTGTRLVTANASGKLIASSSGAVIMKVALTSAYTASAATVIKYDTSLIDTNSIYNMSTATATIPAGQGGYYLVSVLAATNSASTSNVYINVNASAVQYICSPPNSSGSLAGGSAIFLLNAGDTINVESDATRTFTNTSTAGFTNTFCLQQIR